MSACVGCDAALLWAVTENGKAIPLDVTPNPAGNIVLTGATAVTNAGRAGPACENVGPPGLFPDDRVRYMPHHATCPNVEAFR